MIRVEGADAVVGPFELTTVGVGANGHDRSQESSTLNACGPNETSQLHLVAIALLNLDVAVEVELGPADRGVVDEHEVLAEQRSDAPPVLGVECDG